jgi:hypothetical protein
MSKRILVVEDQADNRQIIRDKSGHWPRQSRVTGFMENRQRIGLTPP